MDSFFAKCVLLTVPFAKSCNCFAKMCYIFREKVHTWFENFGPGKKMMPLKKNNEGIIQSSSNFQEMFTQSILTFCKKINIIACHNHVIIHVF